MDTPRRCRDLTRTDLAVVGALTALTAVILALRLDARSIWIDEALSIRAAQLPWRDFMRWIRVEGGNMLAYYLPLRVWVGWGSSAAWVRLPSAGLAVATVPLTWAIGRTLFDRRAAAVAATLVAVHPMVLDYGTEARAYSMALLLLIAAWACAIAAARDGSRRAWAGLVVIAPLSVYTQLLSGLYLGAIAVWLLAVPEVRRAWRRWLAAALITGAALVPALRLARQKHRPALDWIEPLSAPVVWDAVRPLAWAWSPWVSLVVLAVCAAAATAGLLRWRTRPDDARALLPVVLWAVLPLVALIAVSWVQPLLVSRYLIATVPALCLLLGWLVAQARSDRVVAAAVAAVLIGGGSRALSSYRPDDDWRGATTLVLQQSRSDDALVVLPSFSRECFDYQWRQAGAPSFAPTPAFPAMPLHRRPIHDRTRRLLRDALADLGPAPRVWVVLSSDPAERDLRTVRRILRPTHRVVREEPLEGVTVVVYDRRRTRQRRPTRDIDL